MLAKLLTKIVTVPIKRLQEFIQLETASGILLLLVTIAALLLSNSPWRSFYYALFNQYPIAAQPVNFWINEGLMTLFFLVVGLEIKREMLTGELNTAQKRILPGIAALGGMVVPAIIFVLFNWHDPLALKGWAIPTATDIAFALGVFLLLGKRVPLSLKIFLLTLAIIDDLGAVLIITLFYSAQLSVLYILLALICCSVLYLLNYLKIASISVYLLLGLILWHCMLHSGIHPTVAGVLLAFSIPLQAAGKPSPLLKLEHYLHPWVAFGIMPLFAFANAGISFASVNLQNLLSGIPLGIIFGLFLGKQCGILGASWLAVKWRWAHLPQQVTWKNFYGMAMICGIGFTMSLFIGNLAYEQIDSHALELLRIGVLVGSLISGLAGYTFLRWASHQKGVAS